MPTVRASDPAATFAPLVRLHPRETSFPMSARHFLSKAGLEWTGGPCWKEMDVSASASSSDASATPIPKLVPRRLGRSPAYEVRPRRKNCVDLRPQTFTATMRTRPFDREDRPAGLHLDEGFGLDILTDAQPGKRRLDADGTLAGVPVYYVIERMAVDGRPGLRLSYWMLYGRGERRDAAQGGEVVSHEGDWERVDVVVARAGGRHGYVPESVRYHSHAGVREVPWEEAVRAGPGSTHPIVDVTPEFHTPRPAGRCDDCTDWLTWRRLRDARREPWYGYGGAWGAAWRTDATSGPLGPSPYE